MKRTLSKEEHQAKRSKADWRGIEEVARGRLRRDIESLSTVRQVDHRRAAALRNVAVVAAVAKDKAYPEDLVSGLTVFLPARLLQSVQGAMLKVRSAKLVEKGTTYEQVSSPQAEPTSPCGSEDVEKE